jgi:hypothetical protein
MQKKDSIRPTAKTIVDLASTLRLRLNQVANLKGDSALDRLPVDIADIYEVCLCYVQTVDELIALPQPWSKEQALSLLSDIYTDLYIHLPYHYKRLPKGLKKLATSLEPNEGKREELADRRLKSTLLKGKRLMRRLKSSEGSSSPKRK